MALPPISSSNSDAANNNNLNDAIRQLNRDQITKVFKNSTGNGIIQGQLPNHEGYGEILYDSAGLARVMLRVKNDAPEFKISKSGFDVLTASNSQLIFNSSQNTFKISRILTGTFTTLSVSAAGAGQWASNTSQTVLPHGLSYTPAFVAYISSGVGGSTYTQMPYRNEFGSGVNFGFATFYAEVDSTNLYLKTLLTAYGTASEPSTALTAQVYLLQETAN